MSKYKKISNYTIANENFNNIIKEFNGYLLGMSNNDLLLFSDDLDSELVKKYSAEVISNLPSSDDNSFVNNLAPKIFDRSTGAYFIKDYVYSSQLKNVAVQNAQNYINILYRKMGFTSDAEDNSKTDTFEPTLIKRSIEGSPAPYSVKDSLPYVNFTEIKKKQKLNAENKPIKDSLGNVVMEIVGGGGDGGAVKLSTVNEQKDPDRFTSPSLTATVVRTPNIGILAKNSTHMPIFFGGIPPIEMSRCTPYLDIKIITTEFNKDIDKLNQVSFMRFTKQDKDGNLVSEDGIGLNNNHPVDKKESFENNNVSYMDIFTSPQTMANANINRGSSVYGIDNISKNLLAVSNNNNPIYEPISPFATLNSFDVSITGLGIGLMASKSGTLSITLHDRSRLSDLEPLVAVDRFATTKIQVEFGWNHPDGAPGGDNLIGQYLDGLKDVHTYQVLGTSYSFGNGGTVDLTIQLVAYGYRSSQSVHCGAGPFVPLNGLSDLITQAVNQTGASNRKNKMPAEVRQRIQVKGRSAKNLNSVITWETWKNMAGILKNDKNNFIKFVAETFKLKAELEASASEELTGFEEANTAAFGVSLTDSDRSEIIEAATSKGFTDAQNALLASTQKDVNKETLLKSMFGKISGLKDDFDDPFVYSLHKDANYIYHGIPAESFEETRTFNSEERMKHLKNLSNDIDNNEETYVTLGKLLLSFIGWPMASTCLYDEVQMIYYPLNHHAGNARGMTTASLPIPLSSVEKVIVDQLNKNSNISVQSFFNLIERKILSDRSLPAYGFHKLDSVSEIKKLSDNKTSDQKFIAALATFNEVGGTSPEAIKIGEYIKQSGLSAGGSLSDIIKSFTGASTEQELKNNLSKYYNDYISGQRAKISDEISAECLNIYSNDGLGNNILSEPKFVMPNFTVFFESVPAIDAENFSESGFLGRLASNLIDGGSINIGNRLNSDGLTSKSILKIHVYDEEAVSSPTGQTLMSALTSGVSSNVLIGTAKNNSLDGNKEETISKALIDKLSFFDAKEMIKRSYPTIIYGSASSTVVNLSVSANTSGDLANVLMIDNYPNLKAGQVDGHDHDSKFEEVTVFPNTVSIELMGNPLINRGVSFFIDFGTNTSLDNIYTVKSVKHNVGAGTFTTKLELVPSNMGAISSFRDKLSKAISPKKKK